MAHFAKLDENNMVTEVHVVSNDVVVVDGADSEELGVSFLKNLYGDNTNWKQTSYSGSFRKNFAGIGYSYNPELDAFIEPKPFPSWSLNTETGKWDAPVAYPSDGKVYGWFEQAQTWIEIPALSGGE